MLGISETKPTPPPAPADCLDLQPLMFTDEDTEVPYHSKDIAKDMVGINTHSYHRSFVQVSQIPEQYWLVCYLLHQNIWGHGLPQRYSRSFLRLVFKIVKGIYVNLGEIIFDALVECKNQTLGEKKGNATHLWLGHLVTRLITRHGITIHENEPTGNYLTNFNWESWKVIYLARTSFHPKGNHFRPTPNSAKTKRTKKDACENSSDYITRDEFRGGMKVITSQFAYLASYMENLGQFLLKDDNIYEEMIQQSQIEGELRQQELWDAMRQSANTSASKESSGSDQNIGRDNAGTSGTAQEAEEEEEEEDD